MDRGATEAPHEFPSWNLDDWEDNAGSVTVHLRAYECKALRQLQHATLLQFSTLMH